MVKLRANNVWHFFGGKKNLSSIYIFIYDVPAMRNSIKNREGEKKEKKSLSIPHGGFQVLWNNLWNWAQTQQRVNKLPLLSNTSSRSVKSSDFSITAVLICMQASPDWLKCSILSLIVQENCVLCCCSGNN